MLKRDFRLFVRCLASAAVLTAAFAAVSAAAAFFALSGAESLFSPVKTALVNEENSLVSRLAVRTVARMDYVAGMMEITDCGMDEAMAGLEAGDYAAVIVLPRGTMDGILSGRDTKGTIYLSSGAAAHADVVAKVAAFGEVMLTAGQYGIFSGEQLIRENGLGETFHRDFLETYNTLLMSEALRAGSSYFDLCVTDYAETKLSPTAYYALSWLCLLLLLIPMLFSALYTEDLKRPILCRLRAAGIGDGSFLLGKYLLPFVFCLLPAAAVPAALGGLVSLHFRVSAILCALAAVWLAAIIGGSLMMATENGIPVTAAAAAAGLLLCGGLIPRQLLSPFVLTLGSLTPYGAVQNLFLPLFGGEAALAPAVAALLYATALPLLAKRRLARTRTGGDVR